MKKAWEEIKRLVGINATHRKGFRLQEVSRHFILNGARAETIELFDTPNDPFEMADIMGCLIHYCLKSGWTEEEIETCLLQKLKERFSE